MKNFQYIKLARKGNRADLRLNRPKLHNAIIPEMVEEIHYALEEIQKSDKLRFLVISGEGNSFCAGADINWFSGAVNCDKSESFQEYLRMAELLKRLALFPLVTIAAAHKNVKGGGNGLLAACDFSIAEESTSFAFSEINLGIIPATILPFVAKRVSTQNLKKLMFSGEAFWALEARLIGLVDFIADDGNLMKTVDGLIGELSVMPPNALKACKNLIMNIDSGEVSIDNSEFTAASLANLVYSNEGMEGLRAFLEKRKPDWTHHRVDEN